MAQQPLNIRGRRYAQMRAQACSRAEILQELFGLDISDPATDRKAIHAADQQCKRWRDHSGFDEAFEGEINRILRVAAGDAIKVLVEQIRSAPEPYLQNKAANDIMLHRKTALTAEKENSLTIKVEGMPELGTPTE